MDDKSIGAAVSQAIKDSGRTQADVASAVHMDTAALSRSLSGQRAFKFLELAWIADLVGTSVDGLIGRPQTLPFMAAARATSTADAHVNAEVSDIAQFMFERRRGLHQINVGSPSTLPGISDCTPDQAIADRIVDALNEAQGGHWVMTEVDELASAIEKAFGIDVWVRPLPDGIDGYCVHAAEEDVHGIIATSKAPAQRIRFTLAHELAHLILGDDTTNEPHRVDLDGESGIERRANEIAGLILMPRTRIPLREEWTTQQIRSEAHRFRVAPAAFAARVRARKYQSELGTLAEAWPASTGDDTYDAWQRRNSIERPPRRLLHDLAEAYTSGEATARPFAQVAGIDDMAEARRQARALISQSAAA